MDKFKIGDKVICISEVVFSDDTEHVVGQEIVVKASDVSYYNVCHEI